MIPTPPNHCLAVAALTFLPALAPAGEPADIRLGEMTLTPTLRLTETYDDNFREAVAEDAKSSWVTTLEPTLELAAQDRLNIYSLRYGLESDIFHSSHRDDNTDHHLDADAHLEFSSRHRLDLNAGYDRVEQVADSTLLDENDRYHSSSVGAVYGFGIESATMQLELAVDRERKRFDNSGTLNRDKDHDSRALSATAYYRLAPKTRALFEVGATEFDYVGFPSSGGAGPNLDSVNHSYFAGLAFDATAKTTGTLRIGREEKDFDDPDKSDPGLTAWRADLTWNPRTYSAFRLTARQGIDEGSIEEQFVETRTTGIAWNHRWNAFFSTDLAYARTKKDYENAANRRDDINSYRVGLTWDLRRWVSLELGYRYRERDSNVDRENFERNLYSAGLNISL